MKNVVQKYLSSYKKLLPGWDGADIGHTASRDWYVMLAITTMLGLGLAMYGTLRFLEVSQTVSARPESLPVRSFPTDESKILETKNRFDARAMEFKAFSSRVPEAPDPGQEKAPAEPAEEEVSETNNVPE